MCGDKERCSSSSRRNPSTASANSAGSISPSLNRLFGELTWPTFPDRTARSNCPRRDGNDYQETEFDRRTPDRPRCGRYLDRADSVAQTDAVVIPEDSVVDERACHPLPVVCHERPNVECSLRNTQARATEAQLTPWPETQARVVRR